MADWNPWHGCHKLSAGCANCYVYRQDAKHEKDSSVVTKNSSFDLPIKRYKNGDYKIKSGDFVWTCFTSDFLLSDADEWRRHVARLIADPVLCAEQGEALADWVRENYHLDAVNEHRRQILEG